MLLISGRSHQSKKEEVLDWVERMRGLTCIPCPEGERRSSSPVRRGPASVRSLATRIRALQAATVSIAGRQRQSSFLLLVAQTVKVSPFEYAPSKRSIMQRQ